MNRKYRRTVLVGNWKAAMTAGQTKAYAEALRSRLPKTKWCDVILCPPFVSLPAALRGFKDTRVAVGAQDVCCQTEAVTGQVSAPLLAELGVRYVLVGHSDCRLRGDDDLRVNHKLHAALCADLSPLLCVGETANQRELGVTEEALGLQLKSALYGVDARQLRRCALVYQPPWAAETPMDPLEAAGACACLRSIIRQKYGARAARAISILFGGCMTADNAPALLAQEEIDGGLLSSASLTAEELVSIIHAANQ